MDPTHNLIDDPEALRPLLAGVRRVAVLGIKPETHPSAPAHYVPAYLLHAGIEVIPVPVYYPDLTTILGQPVYRALGQIPAPPVDLINVFRRAEDIDQHVDDILAAHPQIVWFQLGIRNDPVARTLAEAGIKVVQDRCLMVDHRSLTRQHPNI